MSACLAIGVLLELGSGRPGCSVGHLSAAPPAGGAQPAAQLCGGQEGGRQQAAASVPAPRLVTLPGALGLPA
eukprot:scaffold383885_cov31-Prasinocladus_malaysianus.AAC.1